VREVMLGDELRRRREALGITLNEISESTRIGVRFLKAIEADNYELLPGAIYTRSFVKAFAKQVGWNEAEALALYQEETETAAPPRDSDATYVDDSDRFIRHERTYGLLPTLLVACLAALVLSTGGWAVWHYMNRPPESAVVPPPPVVDPPPPPPETPARPAAQPSGLSLTLQATAMCWIKYTVDATDTKEFMMKQGDTTNITAANSIDLSVGNTQAVSLRVNDREAHFPENTPIVLKKFVINSETVGTLLD
jgi:cytoskeleton protein RodZ